jgi:hypothetical protein
MKFFLAITFILTASLTFSAELKILSWQQLDRAPNTRSTGAEVCFSVKPAPARPQFVEITVDKGRRSEANYTAWVGPKGSLCKVVSTFRGLVEVKIPAQELSENSEF